MTPIKFTIFELQLIRSALLTERMRIQQAQINPEMIDRLVALSIKINEAIKNALEEKRHE